MGLVMKCALRAQLEEKLYISTSPFTRCAYNGRCGNNTKTAILDGVIYSGAYQRAAPEVLSKSTGAGPCHKLCHSFAMTLNGSRGRAVSRSTSSARSSLRNETARPVSVTFLHFLRFDFSIFEVELSYTVAECLVYLLNHVCYYNYPLLP